VQGDYVVLCPAAVGLHRGQVKAWSGYGRLAEDLRARGLTVLASPGPGETAAVQAAVPGTYVLPELVVDVFAALLASARLVVANDSGAGHVAAAVNAPLLSVIGVTEPQKTRPWGPRATLVGSERGWPDYAEVLAADIRAQLLSLDARSAGTDKFGDYFETAGPLKGPAQKVLRARAIWMTEHLSGETRLITLIPDKS
jgi:hypothetical protein